MTNPLFFIYNKGRLIGGKNMTDQKQNQAYGADQIQVLEGLEAVRKRPGMYIGTTTKTGLHHLVWEIVDNSIDEYLAGHGDQIIITIHKDNSITVEDRGRGIPVEIHSKFPIPTVEVVLTVLHAGGKFGGEGSGYKVSGGLHGVGSSVVNALSTQMTATVKRDGKVYKIGFEKGDTVQPLEEIGTCDPNETGTTIWFKPDPLIFKETTVYDYDVVVDRLKQSAYLNSALRMTLIDEREVDEETGEYKQDSFLFEGGIANFVQDVNDEVIKKNEEEKEEVDAIHHDVIYIKEKIDDVEIEVAFQYLDDYENKRILSFANNIKTKDGGTHESGFKAALTSVIKNHIINNGLAKEKDIPEGEDNRPGLTAVISVKVEDPQFLGQTKDKLTNAEVRPIAEKVITDYLTRYFAENPVQANAIVTKILRSYRERMAARNARNIERKKKQSFGGVPTKLKDCTGRNPKENELFLVEGDSAGGSAINGRDRKTQAILPLRGKVINTAKATLKQIYGNNEILSIANAIGTGMGEDFDYSKLRYHKIIIMTDADVDGHHISILLLTLFYRYMRPLVEKGHIFIANPPLYKVSQGKKIHYEYSDAGLDKRLSELSESPKPQIQRYKGLGEMNAPQLWDTTMNPDTRTLYEVELDEDPTDADNVITDLMGDDVEPRKRFLEENSHRANLDV